MKKIVDTYKNLHVTVKASLWFTVASLFQKGLAFLATPIYTRLLSTDEYGLYSVYISWLGVVTIIATFNLSAGVFNNAILNEKKFNLNDEQILSNFQVLEMILITVVMGAVISLKLLFPNILGLDVNMIVMMGISIFFTSALSLWAIKERYRFKYTWVTLVTIISSITTVILNVLFAYFYNNNAYSLVCGSTIAIVATNVIIMARNIIKGGNVWNLNLWKYAVLFNLPLIPHYLANAVLVAADKIMIDIYRTPSETAIYSVAYSLGNIIIVFVNAINASLAPYTYQKLQSGTTRGIKEFTNRVFVLLIVITCVVVLLGPDLMYVLGGEKYVDAKWVIPPVAGAIVFFFMYPMFANIEFYYEKRFMTMIASVTAAIANIVLNAICIPIWGYVAAAFTTLICYILLSICHYVFYKKICKEKNIMDVYDEKRLLFYSILTLMVVLCAYVLYINDLIRYICMLVAVMMSVVFRSKLIEITRQILKRR